MFRCIAIILLLFSMQAFACKQAALNEEFPINEFEQYDTIVIATVTAVTKKEGSRYGGFVTFSAMVNETIKGAVAANSKIAGKPTVEQPNAVCPTNLSPGDTYLLLLNSDGNVYSLSRFSFPTNSKHPYFSRYVREVKVGINGG
ncbi:hypothetical protein ACJJIL_12275 [Microbulbifer sp. EKSA005]|uniref:hypothetical protein n=1 Tax=Microbulbifer sp. EKSA005 TaxID=3243364 RepID=UPI00404359CA